MFRSFRLWTPAFIVPLLLTFACGGGNAGGADQGQPETGGAAGDDADTSSDSGSAGADDAGEEGPPSKGGRGGRGGSSGTGGSPDAGSEAGGFDAGGAAGEGGSNDDETPRCVSTGSDTPDDDFVDSNCDGIDGDFTRAVFVAPGGDDTAEGTLDAPLGSFDSAVDVASRTGRDVYVCNGTFTRTATITQPVAIYGGYDCMNGARRTKDRAVIASELGAALYIHDVVGPIHIERIAFRSADAVAPGESSQAGSIVAASAVSLSRVEFSAGRGADGKPGAAGADASAVAPTSGAPGANAPTTSCHAQAMSGPCQVVATGGFDAGLTQSCKYNYTTVVQRGGAGGAGANVWMTLGQPLQFASKSTAVAGTPRGAGSYLNGTTFLPYDATFGSRNGWSGSSGADAVHAFGSVSTGFYLANNQGSNGKDGEPGYPGNGGSGGTSWTTATDLAGGDEFYVGGGGAQGGLGGCGGGGAKGGGAGGGSIALVVDNSVVSIELSQFITAAGGAGQNGHAGGKSQPGGSPGAAGTAFSGATPTAAGRGGDGGRGGDSGAGAGGPSIGIVYVGTPPVIAETTYVIGTSGRGGISVRSPNVVNGISADFYDATATPESDGRRP